MKNLFKVGGIGGAGSFQVTDNAGSVEVSVNGVKVLGAQESAIADPAGGSTIDSEARTAISSILSALEAHGIIAT